MLQYRGRYLPSRPAFLLTEELPYDDLLGSPERLAGRPAGGCSSFFVSTVMVSSKSIKVPRIYFLPGSSSGWM
jgi:hypothetical protein